jgi:8-oxo-dGTP pyrophosphatase MutT (NUDIX family)
MDLTFHTPQGRFNFRVGAIIIRDEKVLLVKNPEVPYRYTVGGRVCYDETTEEAVIREVFEETAVKLEAVRPVFFHEQFFDEEITGEHFHELAVYYLMKDSDALAHLRCRSVTERGVSEELVWIPLDELDRHYVVPESLARELRHLPQQLTRVVERD